jgi:hypothetical protein
MKLLEYQLLPLREQINVLYVDGVYIGKRKEENLTVLLYQIDSFYVEVYYRKYRCYVSRLRCFTSTVFLDPYLEQIDVEYLV